MEPSPQGVDVPVRGVNEDQPYRITLRLLAVGLQRACARQPRLNESVHPGESLFGVALGDQAGISADAPADGVKETA